MGPYYPDMLLVTDAIGVAHAIHALDSIELLRMLLMVEARDSASNRLSLLFSASSSLSRRASDTFIQAYFLFQLCNVVGRFPCR